MADNSCLSKIIWCLWPTCQCLTPGTWDHVAANWSTRMNSKVFRAMLSAQVMGNSSNCDIFVEGEKLSIFLETAEVYKSVFLKKKLASLYQEFPEYTLSSAQPHYIFIVEKHLEVLFKNCLQIHQQSQSKTKIQFLFSSVFFFVKPHFSTNIMLPKPKLPPFDTYG